MSNKRARITPENAQATFTSLRSIIMPVSDDDPGLPTSQVVEVEIERIRPNPAQPRSQTSSGFSKSSIEELAENIKEHGLLQPILVKDTGRFYQIVAGERRYRACQLLGMEKIPVRIIEPKDEQEELMISLAENLQRKNLGALEEARVFRTLIHKFGLSYRDLARLSGRSVAHVHGRLQLLEHDDIRQAVEQKQIGIADAIQLARIPDDAQRKELLTAVKEGSLKGSSLHRQVQIFLGEIASDTESSDENEKQREFEPNNLQMALSIIDSLPEEIGEDDKKLLYTIASKAAAKLNMRLVAVPTIGANPQKEKEEHEIDPSEMRKIVSRTKEFRNERGYSIVNLITVYWMSMERRGYTFSPGEWKAIPQGDGSYLVTFTYKIDNEPKIMEWVYLSNGQVRPANDEAALLMG